MSKTPETDKAWNINQDAPHSHKGDPWALASRLERERDELRERVAELVDVLETCDALRASDWWQKKRNRALAKTKEAK